MLDYRMMRSWVLKRLCTFSILTVAVVCVVFNIGKNTPLSPIYRSTHSEKYMRNISKQLNDNRLRISIGHLKSATNLTSLPIRPPFGPQLVVVIITVARGYDVGTSREKPRYLTQTVAAIDMLLKKDRHFDTKFMFICNVDNKPELHEEAVQLQSLFPYVNKKGGTNLNIHVNKQARIARPFVDSVRRKEAEDYIFCLNVSHTFNSSYVLVLEDDVLPSENAFAVIAHTLKYRLGNLSRQRRRSSNRKFSYLKLYYPLKWQGFANEPDRILELIAIGILGGTVVSLITAVFLGFRGREVSTWRVFSSFMYGVAMAIVLALMIGRVNLINVRQYHPQLYKLETSPGCCTPAMLYPHTSLPGIMNYLLYNNSVAKDLGIYNYTRLIGIPGYHLEPNLFMHIGMISTLSDTKKKPDEFVFDISSVLH